MPVILRFNEALITAAYQDILLRMEATE